MELHMATIASHSAIGQFVPDFSSQFLSDLQGLLEKAGRFTGASSAAIAFVDGAELVTKVSMGDCAPEPGSRSPISGSFTGLCVQSREVQRCDDAAKDSRVDAGACQALGIASMVIVPIGEKRAVYGVLAAFSPKANAFSPTHVALLRTVSDIVIELRKRYPVAPAEITEREQEQVPAEPVHVATEAAAPAQSVAETKAPIASLLPTFGSATPVVEDIPTMAATPEPALINPVELRITMAALPVTPEPPRFETKSADTKAEECESLDFSTATEKKPLGPVLVKPEAKPAPRIQASVDLWKREPLLLKNETEPVEEYARVVTPEPAKKSAEILTTAADIGPSVVAKSDSVPSFGSYSHSAAGAIEQQHHAESGARKIMLVAAALIVLVIAGGWYLSHRSSSVSPTEVQAAAPQTHVSSPESATHAPTVSESTPMAAPVSSGPSIATVVKKTDLNLPGSKKKSASDEIADDTTILVSKGSSVPNHRSAAEDVEALKVASTDTRGVGALLDMMKPAQPEAAFRSSSIQAPQLLKSVSPQFPAFARQMHIQNDRVVLNGTVEKDGSVSNVKVVRGKQVFVQPAISAVKQWKYKAAQLNGQPTSSTIEIVVNFVDHN
jgi:TonB family protein